MKNIIYVIFLALITLSASCKKYNSLSDDINGNLYIRGRLYYSMDLAKPDTLTPIPLAGKVVKIGYAHANAVDYIYSATSDADGYFVFTGLSKDSTYLLYSQDTEDSIIFYKQDKYLLKASIDTPLILQPSNILQNGIGYNIYDINGQAVNGCQVCLFKSSLLFQTQNCALASIVLSSNANGLAFKYGIPAGTYYSLFNLKIDSTRSLTSRDQVDIGLTGVSRKIITIK